MAACPRMERELAHGPAIMYIAVDGSHTKRQFTRLTVSHIIRSLERHISALNYDVNIVFTVLLLFLYYHHQSVCHTGGPRLNSSKCQNMLRTKRQSDISNFFIPNLGL